MNNEQPLILTPFGILLLGGYISDLQWGLLSLRDPTQIAGFLQELRRFSRVNPLRDIGIEAGEWHDHISRQQQPVTESDIESLNAVATKWQALVSERLGNLYLITPTTVIDPKRLMGGIEGLLNEETVALLEPIEIADLEEAMRCLLITSPTAAELMAIRAAEALTGRWYVRESKKQVGTKTLGSFLKWFREEHKQRTDTQLVLTLLDYLNQRRHVLAHPRAISRSDHAQTTLLNVCSLVRSIGGFLGSQPASQSETGSNAE